MVKQLKIIITMGINISLIVIMLCLERDKYLYSQFQFDFITFATNIVLLIIANAIIWGVFWIFRKCVSAKIMVGIPSTLIVIWLALSTVLFNSIGAFWKSKTYDFSQFCYVDTSADDSIKVAGLTLTEIIGCEIVEAEDFHYLYCSRIGVDNFIFYGSFRFSEKSYNRIKTAFIDSPEFEIIDNSSQHFSNMETAGMFCLNSQVPSYESKTSVDRWITNTIVFCDENNSFYFELEGYCYT